MKKLLIKTVKNQYLHRHHLISTLLTTIISVNFSTAQAAIALDRTRAIITSDDKSISLNISNENKQLPYLAQAWLEDGSGNKTNLPFTVIPPVQRLEAGTISQIKILALPPSIKNLPLDRESVFYFNLREIPPKSDKPNTLQLALQTRIKLFYRPTSIIPTNGAMSEPWQEKLTLIRQDGQYIVNNPTSFFITIVDASSRKKGQSIANFEPIMIEPKSSAPLNLTIKALGDTPVLTYINDYGGRPTLIFNCQNTQCNVIPDKNSEGN
ncbi:fimbria/pilus periplasmic chaperone [Providencia stuartii]